MDANVFDPVPSRRREVAVNVARRAPAGVVTGYAVGEKGAVPRALGIDRAALGALGFEGKVGQAVRIPGRGGGAVAVGIGGGDLDAAKLRDVAAAYAGAVSRESRLAIDVLGAAGAPRPEAAQALVEGALLARYRYTPLKSKDETVAVESLTIVGPDDKAIAQGAARGVVTAAAASHARDLANSPPSHLTATDIAMIATELAASAGLDIEVFGPAELAELGCGGLLGVNAGSAEEPRMIKLVYTPKRAAKGQRHLAFVGKGVMYDSGGISLKPSDAMHAAMKMDMSGAAAVLSALAALPALKCPNKVTGYLMCTDNMPSGSAMKLGDVLRIHGGTTVEIHNTDAEGRLVLADGLTLAAADAPDAIVDVATLTGACVVALGTGIAGVIGSDQALVDALIASGAAADEQLWQLPLEQRYRKLLDSEVADIKNVGGPYGGAITAALFLSRFVGEIPWAHLDIAGPMRYDSDESWRPRGASGFSTRTLINLATSYR